MDTTFALALAAAVLSAASIVLHVVAPRTKTKIDDALRDDIDEVLAFIRGRNATAPATPAAIRNTQAGKVDGRLLAIVGFCAFLAVFGISFIPLACTPNQRTAVEHALIDCTTADHAAQIEMVEAALAKLTKWDDRYTTAAAYGAVIGGCALLHVVQNSPASASFMPDEGRATFERFRGEVAGGANYKTAGGVQF
jgi:hypothetical protein